MNSSDRTSLPVSFENLDTNLQDHDQHFSCTRDTVYVGNKSDKIEDDINFVLQSLKLVG